MDMDWDNIMVGDGRNRSDGEDFFEMRRDAKVKLAQQMGKENNLNDINKTINTKDLLKIVNAKSKIQTTRSDSELNIAQMVDSLQTMSHSEEASAASKVAAPKNGNVITSSSVCPTKHGNMAPKSSAAGPKSKNTTQHKRPDSAAPIPNAYKYVEIYKKKIAQKEERRREQEREAREFKPRPLPDFKKAHRLMEMKRMEIQVMPICPDTPPTLKRSIEAAARRRQMQEERLLAEKVPDFKARSAEVLSCRPFKPVVHHREIEAEPFDLQSGNRAVERKMYDEAYAKAQEEKRLQEQQEAEEKEQLLRKNLRKQKEFKARPNPFSSSL